MTTVRYVRTIEAAEEDIVVPFPELYRVGNIARGNPVHQISCHSMGGRRELHQQEVTICFIMVVRVYISDVVDRRM